MATTLVLALKLPLKMKYDREKLSIKQCSLPSYTSPGSVSHTGVIKKKKTESIETKGDKCDLLIISAMCNRTRKWDNFSKILYFLYSEKMQQMFIKFLLCFRPRVMFSINRSVYVLFLEPRGLRFRGNMQGITHTLECMLC